MRRLGCYQTFFLLMIPLAIFLLISSSRPLISININGINKENRRANDNARVLTKRQKTPTNSSITKVLFLTYFRSGSSFLGESINKNPEAFYWFEPLMGTFYHRRMSQPFAILQNYSFQTLPGNLVEELCQTIVDVLNCKLTSLDQITLIQNVMRYWQTMEALRPCKSCLRENDVINTNNTAVVKAALNGCLSIAITKCKEANIRGVKTIRIGAYMIEKLLELEPELKIIHSVRDPRGMLLSAIELGHVAKNPDAIRDWMKIWCYRLHVDKEVISEIKANYDVLQIRYEDLVMESNRSLHRIYSYIGRDLPSTVLNWFTESIRARKNDGPLGTVRTNGTAVAFRWRQYLPNQAKAIVEEICGDVLHEYEYLK